MVSNSDVLSFFKQNAGEEDVIKILLLSATKALISVAILIGAIISYFKLCEQFGFEYITLLIISIIIFSMWYCSRELSRTIGIKFNEIDIFHYKTWKYIFENLQFKQMLYFNESEKRNNLQELSMLYFASVIVGVVITLTLVFLSTLIGLVLIYLYAIIISLAVSIYFPPESIISIGTIITSVVLMSALFIKLKWKKIWIDKFNWNLAAWCVCVAVIITMISFITGFAIRRIAGFIGIEYTEILVISYIAITAMYVYLDLKQWLDNKEAKRIAKELREKESDETPSNT